MAESCNSEESSDEVEDNEASGSSLLDPVSSITAASRTSKKKPGLFTERGYLMSLSRQERRRIEREIKKGCKLGEIDLTILFVSRVVFRDRRFECALLKINCATSIIRTSFIRTLDYPDLFKCSKYTNTHGILGVWKQLIKAHGCPADLSWHKLINLCTCMNAADHDHPI